MRTPAHPRLKRAWIQTLHGLREVDWEGKQTSPRNCEGDDLTKFKPTERLTKMNRFEIVSASR